MNELLTFGRFKDFLRGKIDGTDTGSLYVLTLLAMNDEQIFFRPGFQILHRLMLEDLSRPEADVIYAGRLAQFSYGERRIRLEDGGKSMKEYREKAEGRGFVVEVVNGFLGNLKDPRQIS